MINKKITMFGIGVLFVLTLLVGVSAFSYDEDEEGNPFYEADAKIKVPSISINDLFILFINIWDLCFSICFNVSKKNLLKE